MPNQPALQFPPPPPSAPVLGISPRQLDTLEPDIVAEQAAHEQRVLAEAVDIGALMFDVVASVNRSLAAARATSEEPAPSFASAHGHIGRIVRGVNATDLVTVTGGSVQLVAEVARDLEANGDRPCIKFHRSANGQIDGITLCAAVDVGEVA